MELLKDSNEEVRNNVLLILKDITKDNKEIQTNLAFQVFLILSELSIGHI